MNRLLRSVLMLLVLLLLRVCIDPLGLARIRCSCCVLRLRWPLRVAIPWQSKSLVWRNLGLILGWSNGAYGAVSTLRWL